MRCFYCKQESEWLDTKISHVVDLEGRIIIIKNVPCRQCPCCGDAEFTNNVAEKMDEVVVDETKADIKIIKDGTESALYDYSALDKKDKYLLFQGGNYGMVEIEGNGEGVLLVIKDSFANSFVPFLTENYEKIIMLDMRYYMGNVAMLCEKESVSNVLVLYSLSNFISDENMIKLGL